MQAFLTLKKHQTVFEKSVFEGKRLFEVVWIFSDTGVGLTSP